MLKNLFDKYTGSLRDYKMLYTLYNYFHKNKLKQNKNLFKKYNIHKHEFDSISSKEISNLIQEQPWLDNTNAKEALLKSNFYKNADASMQVTLEHWIDNGYIILKNAIPNEIIEEIVNDMNNLLNHHEIDFNYSGKKIMNMHKKSKAADALFHYPRIIELMNFLLGKDVIPFQTISFVQGSEQKAHSDHIHMTTEPKGYLIAQWIALEDIQEGSGTLFYYPGSHKLPYVMTDDYNSGNTEWKIGEKSYANYEDYIEKMIEKHQLKKVNYLPQKGDVLIWHGNLLHGGNIILDKNLTRRSMVGHYYTKDVICYHEITQRPALLDVE